MLIQFRVENHRSLRDEQLLSMVAAELGDNPAALLKTRAVKDHLLPAIGIYGANASGKSNVLQAMNFARHAVVLSHRRWEPDAGVPVETFAFSEKANEPSTYEFDLVVSEVRYRYGFVLSAGGVVREWLQAWPNGRKQNWFERVGDSFQFGKNLTGENETIRLLTRGNSLFLSAAAQNNHRQLLPIFKWFSALGMRRRALGSGRRWLSALDHPAYSHQLSLFSDQEERPRWLPDVIGLLRAADVGIVDMKLKTNDDSNSRPVEIMVRHESVDEARAWLPLEWESSGTKTLLDLAFPVLGTLRKGGVLCIDELEASLHPSLAVQLVRLFNDPDRNLGKGQLVFSTHDTNLLGRSHNEPVLRRDQVWFTEKDDQGATHLYPLTDFHPRKAENLERGYLQGRYGAVPYLSDFENLLPSPRAPEERSSDSKLPVESDDG